MTGNIYSVGQVNAYIKNMFAQDFMMSHIYVRGEVSNCKYHSSGHIYFTLKDRTGVLQAVMFSGSRKKGLKFRMKEGDKCVVLGSIRVYERDGKYQLYAEEILLEGAGLLYQRFEALKRELEEMGMFAPEYKQPIPRFASRVGVVTAPTGAAGAGYPEYLPQAQPVRTGDPLSGAGTGGGCGGIHRQRDPCPDGARRGCDHRWPGRRIHRGSVGL